MHRGASSLPEIVENCSAGLRCVRVWVAGVLHGRRGLLDRHLPARGHSQESLKPMQLICKVFATDIDSEFDPVGGERRPLPDSASRSHVSPQRCCRRHFRQGGRLLPRAHRNLRQTHRLRRSTTSPPIRRSRGWSLVCCRNLLIYQESSGCRSACWRYPALRPDRQRLPVPRARARVSASWTPRLRGDRPPLAPVPSTVTEIGNAHADADRRGRHPMIHGLRSTEPTRRKHRRPGPSDDCDDAIAFGPRWLRSAARPAVVVDEQRNIVLHIYGSDPRATSAFPRGQPTQRLEELLEERASTSPSSQLLRRSTSRTRTST